MKAVTNILNKSLVTHQQTNSAIDNQIYYPVNDALAPIVDAHRIRIETDGGNIEGINCIRQRIALLSKLGLWEDASLILSPGGYKEGKLYSLKPESGAGDFTFSRASTANRKAEVYNQTVPYNLLVQSEGFDTGSWSKTNTTVIANNTVSPIGNLTADRITETVANAAHFVSQQINVTIPFFNYRYSCYVKPNGRNWVYLKIGNGAGFLQVWFDTQNLVVGGSIVNSGYVLHSATVTAVANGFVKLDIKFQSNSFSLLRFDVGLATANGNETYTGDAVSGVWAWGIEFKFLNTTPDAYQLAISRISVPKLDYENGACPEFNFEPARTNLLLWSEQFVTSWFVFRATISSNTTEAPDGTVTADSLLETTENNSHVITQNLSKAGTSLPYTFTVYAKPNGRNIIQVGLDDNANGVNRRFNVLTGEIGIAGSFGTGFTLTRSKITPAANGFYRCEITATTATTTEIRTRIITILDDGTSVYPGEITKGFYLWGAQLEQAEYSSSYFGTTTVAATRSTDNVSPLSATSLLGQTEGAIFLDVYTRPDSSVTRCFSISHSSAELSNRIEIRILSNLWNMICVVNGNSQVNLSTIPVTEGQHRVCLVYRTNYYALFIDGVKVGEDLVATVPATNQIRFSEAAGSNVGHNRYRCIGIWKRAITDQEAIQLTTL